MDRCHIKGEQDDRMHAVLCAAGYNIRWLLRMIVKKGATFLQRFYLRQLGGGHSAVSSRWRINRASLAR